MPDEKVLRNIQQQVLKNSQDIERIKELAGGVVGIQGPRGPQGVRGPAGNTGPRGSKWFLYSYEPLNAIVGDIWLKPDGIVMEKTSTGWVARTDIRGPQGIQGIQGEIGPVGPQGETGPVGPQGPQGENFIIKGPVTTANNLPDPTTQHSQTAYLVGSAAPYLLYVISDGQWINAGSFASLDNIQVIVLNAPDSATQGTLTQEEVNKLANNDCVLILGNHVFHKTENHADDGYWEYASFDNSNIYVITIMTAGSWVKNIYNNNFIPDDELSPTSAEPVENRVITAKFNELEGNISTNAQNISRTNARAENSVKYSEVEDKLSNTSSLPVQNKIISKNLTIVKDDVEFNQNEINAIKALMYFYIYNDNGYLKVDYNTHAPTFSINSNGELIYEGNLNLSRNANNIILNF